MSGLSQPHHQAQMPLQAALYARHGVGRMCLQQPPLRFHTFFSISSKMDCAVLSIQCLELYVGSQPRAFIFSIDSDMTGTSPFQPRFPPVYENSTPCGFMTSTTTFPISVVVMVSSVPMLNMLTSFLDVATACNMPATQSDTYT